MAGREQPIAMGSAGQEAPAPGRLRAGGRPPPVGAQSCATLVGPRGRVTYPGCEQEDSARRESEAAGAGSSASGKARVDGRTGSGEGQQNENQVAIKLVTWGFVHQPPDR